MRLTSVNGGQGVCVHATLNALQIDASVNKIIDHVIVIVRKICLANNLIPKL